MKCYIIDDEPHAIQLISDLIDDTPGLELIGSTTNPLHAEELILNGTIQVDVIFLDIEMPEANGIDLAESLNKHAHIVFTTGHRHYGVEAFGLSAADYLLKPIFHERFCQAIERVKQLTENQEVFIRSSKKGKWIKMKCDEILYIESQLNYLIFYLENKTPLITAMTMAEIQDKLRNNFEIIRIHRSFIINKAKIVHIENKTVLLHNDVKLPISNSYYKEVIDSI